MDLNTRKGCTDTSQPIRMIEESGSTENTITASKNGQSVSSQVTIAPSGKSFGDAKQEPYSGFLKLPTELRVMIYKSLVRQTGPKLYMSSQLSDHDFGPRIIWLRLSSKFEPAILRLSWEIHNEALPVIYENIPVVVQLGEEQPDLPAFLEGFVKTPFRFIQRLEWSVYSNRLSAYKPFTTTTAFDCMPNLKGPKGAVIIRLEAFGGGWGLIANVCSLATMGTKRAQVWMEGYTSRVPHTLAPELREQGLAVVDLTVVAPPPVVWKISMSGSVTLQ